MREHRLDDFTVPVNSLQYDDLLLFDKTILYMIDMQIFTRISSYIHNINIFAIMMLMMKLFYRLLTISHGYTPCK